MVCWTEKDKRNIYQAPIRYVVCQKEKTTKRKIHRSEKNKRGAFDRESINIGEIKAANPLKSLQYRSIVDINPFVKSQYGPPPVSLLVLFFGSIYLILVIVRVQLCSFFLDDRNKNEANVLAYLTLLF